MPRLSIIIPLLGASKNLDDTLVSVLENRPAQCEILVVHNEPYDDPYQLSNEVCFIEARRGAGWGECLGLGISQSRSPFLHILTCGIEVCAEWTRSAVRRFHDPKVAAVAPVIVFRENRSRVVSAGIDYHISGQLRRLGTGEDLTDVAIRSDDPCGPDLLAAFLRKSALDAVGGIAVGLDGPFLGGDLGMALRHAGFRCVLEPDCMPHVAADMAIAEKPSFSRGRNAERLFWHRASQNGWIRSVIGHVAMLAGECAGSLLRPTMIAQLLGRAWGVGQALLPGKKHSPQNGDVALPTILQVPHLAVVDKSADTHASARVA